MSSLTPPETWKCAECGEPWIGVIKPCWLNGCKSFEKVLIKPPEPEAAVGGGLVVVCEHCRRPLKEPGALIFSPPTGSPPWTICGKQHVCVACWDKMIYEDPSENILELRAQLAARDVVVEAAAQHLRVLDRMDVGNPNWEADLSISEKAMRDALANLAAAEAKTKGE